jgi:hypothetical protein
MKSLIISSLFFSSMSAFACTNFSGTYRFPNENNNYQLVQNGCQSIQLISHDYTVSVVADNAYHETLNQDIEIAGQKIGVMLLSHRARFGASELFLDTKAHIEMAGQVQNQETSTVNTLLANGDLQSVATFEDGHQETTIGSKIK